MGVKDMNMSTVLLNFLALLFTTSIDSKLTTYYIDWSEWNPKEDCVLCAKVEKRFIIDSDRTIDKDEFYMRINDACGHSIQCSIFTNHYEAEMWSYYSDHDGQLDGYCTNMFIYYFSFNCVN